MTRVAVVGGGITGLATAWRLASMPDPPEVVVHEASERFGGKIATSTFAGVATETGPDAMLARVPWASALVHELGLSAEVVHPATSKASVWARGKLRPLPEGLLLGVPGRLGPLARSGILSPLGMLRAGLDVVLPPSGEPAVPGDPSIAETIGGRFGPEVVERLVDPLLSGINAGRADRLSLSMVAPDVAAVASKHRSLLLALRDRPPPDPTQPVFLAVRGGLSRLVDRLVESLRDKGVTLRTGDALTALPDAGAVVLTVPAFAAAPLVGGDAARELEAIEYASVALVTLAYADGELDLPADTSGFLVPRREGWLMTAATFVSAKWPERKPDGVTVIRCSAGRIHDERPAHLDDAALVARLAGELSKATGIEGEPEEWRVDRWPRSFPQFEPGHLARVERIEAALPPHVVVAGAAYRGVGIASCIRQAEDAAVRAYALAHGG